MSENKYYCIGCGSLIQTDDKTQPGYTPNSAFEKGLESGQLYCQRCFKLRHYNQIEAVSMSDDQFLSMLQSISYEKALVVNVIDIFDVYGSLITGLPRLIGDNPILVVANKIDLLPKSTNLKKVRNWLSKQLGDMGIHPIDILLVSAHKKYAIDELIYAIDEYRQGLNTYVVGVTNVGKSTLINRIIASIGGDKDLITTSQFPGTTLGQIHIPFDEETALIDTPGIIHRHQMAHYLDSKSMKKAFPQQEIRPTTYQLNARQTLFLGGLARFDYIEGNRHAITCYFSKQLPIHRTKLENADKIFEEHYGKLLSPTSTERTKWARHEFRMEKGQDIVISGLGWIRVHQPCTVAISTIEGVDITIREAII